MNDANNISEVKQWKAGVRSYKNYKTIPPGFAWVIKMDGTKKVQGCRSSQFLLWAKWGYKDFKALLNFKAREKVISYFAFFALLIISYRI